MQPIGVPQMSLLTSTFGMSLPGGRTVFDASPPVWLRGTLHRSKGEICLFFCLFRNIRLLLDFPTS